MADLKPFDGKLDAPTSLQPFDGALDGEAPKPAGAIRKIADLGLSAAKGVVAVPEAAVGLADLVTGGHAGKLAESAGVRFKDAKDVLTGWQSDDLKSKQQEFQQADGILSKTGVALSNPSLIANAVAESLPLMGAGGVGARGLLAAAPKLGAVGAGALGEGVAGAGSAGEQIRQESPDGLLTGKQAALGAASGAATAAFGAAGGKLAKRMGIGDIDTMIAGGTTQVAAGAVPKGVIRRMAEGALSEGVLEELPQSVSEQALQNVALDRPVTQGLADAAVMGTLTGGVMGAGAGAISSQVQPPAATPEPPAGPTLQIGNTPDPYLSFSDGTVARRSEIDAYINALPPEQQPAARAKVMGLAPQPADQPISDIGIPTSETPAPVKPSEAMGLNPAAGPMSAAATVAVDTGVHEGIKLQEANAADQAAYEQATAEQERQAAERDSIDKPITHGPIAEAAMSDEDKRAILFSNQAVADGGRKYKGTLDGDILNGMGKPYPTRFAAQRRARLEGSGWTIAQVQDGFVARRKDAQDDGSTSGVQPVPAGSGERGNSVKSPSVAPALGLDGDVGRTVGAGLPGAAQTGESVSPASGVDATPVTEAMNGDLPAAAQQSRKQTDLSAPSDGPATGGQSNGSVQSLPGTNESQPSSLQASPDTPLADAPVGGRLAAGSSANDTSGSRNVQDQAPGANPTPAQARVEAPPEMGGDAAAATGLPAVGTAGVEGAGIETDSVDGEILNLQRIAAISRRQKMDLDVLGMASDRLKESGRLQEVLQSSSTPEAEHPASSPALDRIAAGKAWFGNGIKARQFIESNGLGNTHTVSKTGPSRFDVVAKVSQPQEKTSEKAPEAIEAAAQQQAAGPVSGAAQPAASDGAAPAAEAPAAQPSYAINDAIRTLRAKAHNNAPKTGPRGDVRMSSHHKGANFGEWVSFDDAVEEARKAVASGVRPVPFQIHNALDVNIGDTDRIIAALSAPVAKPVTPQVAPATLKEGIEKIRAAREDKKPKASGLRAKMEQARQARADYFTPGNIVTSYGGHDEVLSYTPPKEDGSGWSVKVRAMVKQDGKWVPDPDNNRERSHSTQPDARELAKGPVEKAKPAPAADPMTGPIDQQIADSLAAVDALTDDEAKAAAVRMGKKLTPLMDAKDALKQEHPDDIAHVLAGDSWNGKGWDKAAEPIQSAQADLNQASIFDAPAEIKDAGPAQGGAQPASKAATIQDAGQKIGGARKDKWKDRGLDLNDLDGMSESEGAELATKANVWKPDYAAMAEATEPVTAAMVKTVYDQLAAQPKINTPVGRRNYVTMMQAVRKAYSEAKSPEDVKNAGQKIKTEIGLYSTDPAVKAKAREVLFSVYKGRSDPFTLSYNELSKAKKLVEDGFPAQGEPWKKRLSIRAYAGQGFTPRGIELTLEESAELGTPLTTDQIAAGFYRINNKDGKAAGYAPTKADAEATAKTIYERDLKKGASDKPEPVRPNLDELKRENMPGRIDRDVTADDFVKDFGFRGVEFGNWAAQDERQRIINMAYDGLMDLAEIMGVPPKAMSLNGTMGMAFGARGGGKFAAHYEPGKLVINMTKINGGGSMAHEWAHALDHYFGELNQKDAYTTKARGASGWYDEQQYKGLAQTRMEKDAAGKWVTVNKLRLDNMRPEMAKAFDGVMSALFSGQETKAQMVRGEELAIERYQALADKESDPAMKATYLRGITSRQQALEELRKDPEDKMYPKGRSTYATEAQKLVGKSTTGYWTRPTEMFARAFESWVFDKVAAMGARSDYLVHGVEEDRFAGGGYKGNPYPTGPERANINAAFDKLASTIQTKETDNGVAMFSRSQSTKDAYETRIDELFAGSAANRVGVKVLDKSDVLGMLELGEKPLVLQEGSVSKAPDAHPRMTAALWKKVPEWIENPAGVFDSDTDGGLVFIGPESVNGAPVRIIVEPDGRGGDKLKVSLLVNAYDAPGKAPYMRWINDGMLRFADTKKFPAIFAQSVGRQLPDTALQNKPGTRKILTEKNLAGYRRAQGTSMSRGNVGHGLSLKSVQGITAAIRSAWANSPDIVVASDMQDAQIPQAVRDYDQQQKSLGATGEPEGFVYGGKVYLLANQLPTSKDVIRVLFHESLGHMGLRGVFGDALKPILQQIATMRKAEVTAKARQYGLDMSVEAERLQAAEEVLAEMAQTRPEIGFVKRAIAAIRNWLRANVPGFSNLTMKDADIIERFILPARAFVERGARAESGMEAVAVFSRSIGDTLNAAANSARDVNLPAGYKVADLINSAPGKLGWWHKSVGTMYNLAQRSKAFKRVFDSVQRFLNDVSFYATEAADLAPNILPKLETLKDIGKSPLSPADTKAISAPIFEGTLIWARDESGLAVKVATLEAQAASLMVDQKAQRLLRGGHVSEQVMKMWQGLPIDQFEAIINGKYERDMLKAGVVFTDAELKSLFNLTDKQIPLYREFRAATDKSLTNLAVADMIRFGGDDVTPIRETVLESKTPTEAANTLAEYLRSLTELDPDRADVLRDTADKMITKGDKAADLIKRGYAPLSRFGQYTLDVVDAGGERVYFGLFESAADAARMRRKMEGLYPQAAITQGTISEQAYKMFAGVSPETLELFGDMLGLEASGDGAANEAFQTYLKLAKANRSAMKRLIQRKGIAGFSEDAGRVLAGFVYSNARQTASSLHMGEMTKAAADKDAFRNQGELQDAAVKLVDYIKNPQEEAQAFRGLLFAQYIGGSIASAMVNMTQPITMTFPWLSQFAGVTGAAKQMAAAVKDANKAQTGDAALDAALHRAEEDGTVSPQEVHQLMQQAQGRGALQSGDGTRSGNALAAANNTLSRIALAWGKPFSWAEQMNRRITFIAAYRTAVVKGMSDPDGFARKAIAETQGIYNKGNKPQWARGALGSTLFTFKQYSVAYVEMLSRMAKSGPEGKKAALLALAVLFLTAGAGGMPGSDDIDDLISGFLQSMGYNFDSKAKRKAFFAELVGEGGAQFMERGISGLPGVPIDVSGRMGLGNLIPGTGLFTKKQDHTRDVAELFGPGGDLVKRGFDAAGKVINGELAGAHGAAMTIAPKAMQNLGQAFDMASMGMYRDAKGMKVLDTDGYDALAKAIGFQPADVKRSQDASFEVQRMIGLNKIAESEIADRWAQGLFEKDQAKVQAARDDLREWNADNPSSPIRINFRQIAQRVHNMNLSKAERIAKTSPKEIRQAVRQGLELQ